MVDCFWRFLVFTTFRRYVLPLAATIALVGCASGAKKNEEALAEAMPNKMSSFRNMNTYPGNVTCGEYLDQDYQGFPEFKSFVVVDTVANMRPTKLDVSIFCSDNPKAALNDALNVDFDAQQASIMAIMQDFAALESTLAAYEKDNRQFPMTDQGLAALVTPTTVGKPPRNFPEGGYLSSIPVDPWGKDYIYQCEPFGGIRIMYKLRSLGADGKIGGEGENADINYSHMKYYTHVADL